MSYVMIAFLCHIGWTVDCSREFRIERIPTKDACEEVLRDFVSRTRPQPRGAICVPQTASTEVLPAKGAAK